MTDKVSLQLCALLKVPLTAKRATLHIEGGRVPSLTAVSELTNGECIGAERVEQFDLAIKSAALDNEAIKSAYIEKFGSEQGWRGKEGSHFIEGFNSGWKGRTA